MFHSVRNYTGNNLQATVSLAEVALTVENYGLVCRSGRGKSLKSMSDLCVMTGFVCQHSSVGCFKLIIGSENKQNCLYESSPA